MKKGFTLIEMIVTLSICGLALGLLISNYRDTQAEIQAAGDAKKVMSDMRYIADEITQYTATHMGVNPADSQPQPACQMSPTFQVETQCTSWPAGMMEHYPMAPKSSITGVSEDWGYIIQQSSVAGWGTIANDTVVLTGCFTKAACDAFNTLANLPDGTSDLTAVLPEAVPQCVNMAGCYVTFSPITVR